MANAQKPKNLLIRAMSKRNGLFLTVLGILLFLLLLVVASFWWDSFKIQLIFLFMACFVVFFLGVLKLKEPDYSYQLDEDGLIHFHRCGSWKIYWDNIQRVGLVKPDQVTMEQRLSYTGVKLKDIQALADGISPRLANRLLHEQKPLLMVALRHGQLDMQESIINFDPYPLNGKLYRGPLGAFLHRSQALHKAYGYHLFLADDTLDRDPDEFIQLLKQTIETQQKLNDQPTTSV
ncbi:DUF2982 domain-containing protein [Thalassotalea litorea]|uniref:DUF2982 domain-containing protein n=1 Tax=Thalassotalea litorea TaxID=2020715 RepID=A0A5R9IL36_9GAMM|nr:DUF2982 domain-containing protein [Thalassotalea litorea]TLU66245.1 DUF2982 domain-containing protein [Thalassotalea litorea]